MSEKYCEDDLSGALLWYRDVEFTGIQMVLRQQGVRTVGDAAKLTEQTFVDAIGGEEYRVELVPLRNILAKHGLAFTTQDAPENVRKDS